MKSASVSFSAYLNHVNIYQMDCEQSPYEIQLDGLYFWQRFIQVLARRSDEMRWLSETTLVIDNLHCWEISSSSDGKGMTICLTIVAHFSDFLLHRFLIKRV